MRIAISLIDDGTLDTVIECCCPECDEIWDARFDSRSIDRLENGALTDDALTYIEDTIEESHDEICNVR